MTPRWFEKVESKAKSLLQVAPAVAASLIRESGNRIYCYFGSEILHDVSQPRDVNGEVIIKRGYGPSTTGNLPKTYSW
jgi:hypothetical protein